MNGYQKKRKSFKRGRCYGCGGKIYYRPSTDLKLDVAVSAELDKFHYCRYLHNVLCFVCGKSFRKSRSEINRCKLVMCSNKCKARLMSENPEKYFPKTTGRRGNGGKREDLKNMYFRSTWESNYARYLNFLISKGQIKRWEFEVDVFEFPVKRGSKFYTPDFKVWASDSNYEYHEVKGYMDQKSATKLKRMKKYYPNEKLVLIQKEQYREISKWQAIIPGWEKASKKYND